jgi:hypothetical protein
MAARVSRLHFQRCRAAPECRIESFTSSVAVGGAAGGELLSNQLSAFSQAFTGPFVVFVFPPAMPPPFQTNTASAGEPATISKTANVTAFIITFIGLLLWIQTQEASED